MVDEKITGAIAKLRQGNPDLETKRLLDQAEQLLDLERRVEARGLLEKAEALATASAQTDAPAQVGSAEGSD